MYCGFCPSIVCALGHGAMHWRGGAIYSLGPLEHLKGKAFFLHSVVVPRMMVRAMARTENWKLGVAVKLKPCMAKITLSLTDNNDIRLSAESY